MREETIIKITESKVITIVRGLEEQYLIPLAESLYQGGIRLIEITFDQKSPDSWKDTCNGIKELSKRFNGNITVGAGTALTKNQVNIATEAGAKYIISPDANPEIIEYARKVGVVSPPGCMTPTEITSAINAGADMIKLFPAATLGANYVKAIKAPLSHIKMLAVGGVNTVNASDFIKAGCIGIGVGGNLVNLELIKNKDFNKITEAAKEYTKAVQI